MAQQEEYDESGSDASDLESIDEQDLADATLPEPQPIQIKISTLHRRYRNGLIELNPYYQRDVVWPQLRQSGLINSIFNNYYIPPVIFQTKKVQDPRTPNARPTLYQTAIDGKQRLSSIIEFMAGRIPYKDPRGVTWWYPVVEAQNRKGKILTKELKDRFDNWSLLCIEYEGLKQQQEEDLFARVQQGMALSNNEKQMASHTPWIKLVKEIMKANKEVTEICGDMKRGKDFGNIANVVVSAFYNGLRQGNEPLGLKTSQASLSKVINKMDYGVPTAKFAGRMRLLFKVWTDLYNASPQTFSNSWPGQSLKKFSPIEYLATGVLLDMYLDERDNETLISDINAMRKYIRSGNKIVDLRTNTGTWRWFWDFIEELEKHRGKGARPPKADRMVPAAVAVEPHHDIPQISRDRLILASGPVAPGSSSGTPRRSQVKTPKKSVSQPDQSEGEVPLPKVASAKKRKADNLLPASSNEESNAQVEHAPHVVAKPVAPAEASGPAVDATQKSSATEIEERDDEIFDNAAQQTNSQAQHINNLNGQGQQALGFPQGFSPELLNMWAQMQAMHAQQQQQQQQQQHQQQQQNHQQMPQGYQGQGQFSGGFSQHQQQNGQGHPTGQVPPQFPGQQNMPGYPTNYQYGHTVPPWPQLQGQAQYPMPGQQPNTPQSLTQPPQNAQAAQPQRDSSTDAEVREKDPHKRKKLRIDLGEE